MPFGSSGLLTDDDVSLGGLLFDQVVAVQVAVDEGHIGVGLGYLGSLLFGPDQSSVGPIGVLLVQGIEGIAADVAGGTSAVGLSDAERIMGQELFT